MYMICQRFCDHSKNQPRMTGSEVIGELPNTFQFLVAEQEASVQLLVRDDDRAAAFLPHRERTAWLGM